MQASAPNSPRQAACCSPALLRCCCCRQARRTRRKHGGGFGRCQSRSSSSLCSRSQPFRYLRLLSPACSVRGTRQTVDDRRPSRTHSSPDTPSPLLLSPRSPSRSFFLSTLPSTAPRPCPRQPLLAARCIGPSSSRPTRRPLTTSTLARSSTHLRSRVLVNPIPRLQSLHDPTNIRRMGNGHIRCIPFAPVFPPGPSSCPQLSEQRAPPTLRVFSRQPSWSTEVSVFQSL